MKVMVMVKATSSSEAGKMPSETLLTAMGDFNEKLVKAGLMEFGEGLKPSSEGVRIRFSGSRRTVTKGPFTHTNELVAGFWIWNVKSMDEAIEWVKQCPNPMEEESDIEIRALYEMEDFSEVDTTGKVAEQENTLRHTMALQQASIKNYLFFSGRCEEALRFYEQHLGARINFLMRFNESPDAIPEGVLQEGFENKVMHAEITVGGVDIYASDGCDDGTRFNGFRLALTLKNKEDAERVFVALATNGKIDMPLTQTFWSPLYGQVTDQFGVGWMVMLSQ